MRPYRWAGLVLVVGCVGLVGCQKLLERMAPEPERPATEDECRAFGAELEAAVAAGDRARTAELFALERPFYKAVSDFQGPPEYHAQLRRHAEQDARTDPLVPDLLEAVRRGGQLKLLRVHTVDGRPRALVRYIGPGGSVDYLDFLPVRRSDGRVVSEDFLAAANGELASQTDRRLQLHVAAEQGDGPPGHPRSAARLWVPHIPCINAMRQAAVEHRYAQAVAIYRALPAEIRADRSMCLRYLWAADGVSDTEFLVALDGFRRQFPGDPALLFQDVDYYRLMRDFNGALKAVDRAEKAIGGDPYLNALRAKLLVKAWRHKEARAAADKAIEQEPGLTHGYWGRIAVCLAEADHPGTLAYLKRLVEVTGQAVGDLREDPDYVVFVRSPEFREWVRWYAGRKKA